MNSITWTNHHIPANHTTLRSFQSASECRTSSGGATTCLGTDDDRMTFSNGGRLEDLPGEGGLLLTTPDGVAKEISSTYGFVHHDDDVTSATYREPAVYFNAKDEFGDTTVWKQTFPADGGTVLQYADRDTNGFKRTIVVDSTGGMKANFEDDAHFGFPSPELSASEGSIVFEERGTVRLTPPVPLDWLVAGK